MSQTLLLVEEVDVRRLEDPDDSRVETLTKMLFPAIKFKTIEHTGGGSTGTVDYRLPMIEKLEPTFSVKGLDRGSIKGVGLVPGSSAGWTFAAAVRDVANGNKIIPVRGTIVGTVTEYTPGEHSPGESLDCDHAIKEITSYKLEVNGDVWVDFSVRPRRLIMFGVDIFAPYVTALGA